MPYIIELDFEGTKLVSQKEHMYIEKEFKGRRNDSSCKNIYYLYHSNDSGRFLSMYIDKKTRKHQWNPEKHCF